ncbi:hypothetical protein [Rheinheimera sp.]|uniref:hypothetical protein n=1 Tax=Rheinheimera sp. TaxID=1869214 RepID=UPI004047F3CC
MVSIDIKIISSNTTEIPTTAKALKIESGNFVFNGFTGFVKAKFSVRSIKGIKLLKNEDDISTFTIEFTNERYVTIVSSSKAYDEISTFISNSVVQQDVELEENTNKDEQVRISATGLSSIKDELKNRPGVTATLIVLGLFALMILSPTGEVVKPKTLTHQDKIKVCKGYIGALFVKPVNIIEYNGSQNDLIYVRYVRKLDNTTWSYVCDLSGGTISWAGWQKDYKEWGRWREEDEIPYYYDKANNTVYFTLNRRESRIIVQL